VLMLQREAALVEEMRAAAADFRKRFDPPLQAAQASRDDFLVNSGPQLPPSLTDSLPRPPSFLLSVLGLSPDMCAKLK